MRRPVKPSRIEPHATTGAKYSRSASPPRRTRSPAVDARGVEAAASQPSRRGLPTVAPTLCWPTRSFEMALAMPSTEEADLPALEARHMARVNARPAPPPRFSRSGFVGRWRLLLVLDVGLPEEESTPAFFTLNLEETPAYRCGTARRGEVGSAKVG